MAADRTTKLSTVCVVVFAALLGSAPLHAEVIGDAENAAMLMMKARFLVGAQPTTQTPGNQRHELNARRGGPHAAHFNQGRCGGISVGNVHPVIGDHRRHHVSVNIMGHIYNSNNRC